MPTFHFSSSGPGWSREEYHFGGDQGFETEGQRKQYEEYRRSRATQHIFQCYKGVSEGRWLETTLADIQKDFPDVLPPKYNAKVPYFFILYDNRTREYIFCHEPGYLCLFDHTTHSWQYLRSDKCVSPEEAFCVSEEDCKKVLREEMKKVEGNTIISYIPQ